MELDVARAEKGCGAAGCGEEEKGSPVLMIQSNTEGLSSVLKVGRFGCRRIPRKRPSIPSLNAKDIQIIELEKLGSNSNVQV